MTYSVFMYVRTIAEVSPSMRPASPAASYLSNSARNSQGNLRNMSDFPTPMRPQPNG